MLVHVHVDYCTLASTFYLMFPGSVFTAYSVFCVYVYSVQKIECTYAAAYKIIPGKLYLVLYETEKFYRSHNEIVSGSYSWTRHISHNYYYTHTTGIT